MASDLTNRNYLRYSPAITKIPETEAEDIQAIIKAFTVVINGDFNQHGHSYAATHARTLGVVKGKLVVSDNLPKHLKQGLFATGGEWPVVMRYSTVGHDVGTDDRTVGPRAVTVKILNVDGDRFPEGAGGRTQDFEMNSGSTITDLPDARGARKLTEFSVKAVSDPKMMATAAAAAAQNKPDSIAIARNAHPESLSLYSQVPYRFGDYMAKHRLVPATAVQNKEADLTVKHNQDTPAAVRTSLKQFYSENTAEYEWQCQLCENLEDQPIEFSGKVWDDQKYPYQTAARLVFPKQDSLNYELKTFWEDHLRSDSWHGVKSFEPIGGTNRVRRAIYPYARQLREKLNGRKVIEIQGMEDLPGPIPEGVPTQTYLKTIETRLRGHISTFDIGSRVWK